MGKKIKHCTIMFSSGRKTLFALEKFCLQWSEQIAQKDTKLSFALPSSLFLGTLKDLNIKLQNFRLGNDLTNDQDQSYYFAYKFKRSSRRGDLSNDTKW